MVDCKSLNICQRKYNYFSLFGEHTYDRDINCKYQSASPSGMISKLVSSTLTVCPILVPHLNLVKTRVNFI